MESNLKRFFIKKEKKNCFIAVDHRNKKFKIMKNDYSRKFEKNDDAYMYYTVVKKGIFYTVINPISDEEFAHLESMVS